MRTLNIKVVVVFLVGVSVVAGSTHLLHNFQVTRHSSFFRTQAYAFWDETPRRYTDAIQCMKWYLQLAPKDLKAKKDLGYWLADTGQFGVSAALLEELLRNLGQQNDPANKATINEVSEKLVDLEMTMGNCEGAKAHLTALLKNYPLETNPNSIDDKGASFLKLRGQCESALGDDRSAIKDYKLALKNPANRGRVDIYYVMAMTNQYKFHDLPEAKRCWVEMLRMPMNEKSANAHLSYGVWLCELHEYDEALEQAMVTLKLQENHAGGLHLAGECLLNLGRFDEAEKYAMKAIEASKESMAVYMLAADVYMRTNRREKAIEIVKQGLAAVKSRDDRNQLLWHLANLDLDSSSPAVKEENIREAEDCIQQLREFSYTSPKLELLNARVLYANDDWKSALAAFENVRDKMEEFPPLMKCLEYWEGYCYWQQENLDQAQYSFRRSLSYDRFYFKAHDAIAQIDISKNDYASALQEYEAARLGNPNDPEVWLACARTLVMDRLRRNADPRAWEDVKAALRQAQSHVGNDPRFELLVAEVAMASSASSPEEKDREKAADAAEKILKALHEAAPQNVEFYVGLANLEARRGRIDKAREVLNEAEANPKLRDHYLIRLARARLAMADPSRAGERIEDLAQDLDAYSISEKTALLSGLLDDLMVIKDLDRAKQTCQRLARLQPHDAMIRYRLLELALATHDFRDPVKSLGEVDRVLDEIDSIAGRGPLWNYGKAVRLRLQYQTKNNPELLDQAMKFAFEAQRQRVDWSRPHALQGEIAALRGDKEDALQHYLQASLLGDQDLEMIRRLLRMLSESQRYDEAKKVILRLDTNQVHMSPELMHLVAQIFGTSGDLDRALQYANKDYKLKSDDYNDHLWHGQVLRILYRRAQSEGRRDKLPEIFAGAQKSLQMAIEIAPAAPACRIELVQLLVAADRMDEARAAAAAAENAISPEAAPLAMGFIYDALGDKAKAAASYEKAVAQQPDSPLAMRTLADFYIRQHDWQRAAPLIEKLLGSQFGAGEIDLVAARRMQAAMLAKDGYPNYREALALIDQNLKSPLAAPQDKRFRAQILMADPTTALGPEPLKLMTELVEQGTVETDPQDRYELSRLYLRLDRWNDCKEQMEKLVNAPQCEPRYVAAYVKMLFDHGLVDDAALWLSRFEQRCQTGEEIPLHAEAMFRGDHWGELRTYLLAQLDSAHSVQRALIIAQLFEDFGSRLRKPSERSTAEGYFDEAGRIYENSAKSDANGQLRLAAFYARHGRTSAAIDLISKFADQASPGSVAVAAVTLAESESVKPEQLQQVQKVVAAAAAHDEPLPLLTALGVLEIAQGQPDKAEELYRRVVAKNSKDFHAFNNLALLLALSGNKLDEALDLINQAIELAGKQPKLLDSRAVVHICRNEPDLALKDLELILADKAEKAEPEWLFHKAWALKKTGTPEAAAAAAEVINRARSNNNLDRSKVDPPERAAYDQLMKDLGISE